MKRTVTRTQRLGALARAPSCAPTPAASSPSRPAPTASASCTASSPATWRARRSGAAACPRCSRPRVTSSPTCACSFATTQSGSSSTPARREPVVDHAGALRDHGRLRGGAARRLRVLVAARPGAAARLAAIGVDAGAIAAAPLFAHAQVADGDRRGLDRAHARARHRRFLAGRPAAGPGGDARAPRRRGRARAGAGGGGRGAHRRRRAALRRRDHPGLFPDGGRPGWRDRLRQGLLPRSGADRAHPRPRPHQLAARRPGRGRSAGSRRAGRDRKRRQAEGRAGDQRGPPARRPRRRAGDASHQHRRGATVRIRRRRGAHRRARQGRNLLVLGSPRRHR